MKNIDLVRSKLPENHPIKSGEWAYFEVAEHYILQSQSGQRVFVYADPDLTNQLLEVDDKLYDQAVSYRDSKCVKAVFLFTNDSMNYKFLSIDTKGVLVTFNVDKYVKTTLEDYLGIPYSEQSVCVKGFSSCVKFKVRDFADKSVLYIEDYIRYVNYEDIPSYLNRNFLPFNSK